MRKLWFASIVVLLTGCGDSDVKKFIKQTDLTKGPVEPLPVLTVFKTYQYASEDLRSPFGEAKHVSISSDQGMSSEMQDDHDNKQHGQSQKSAVTTSVKSKPKVMQINPHDVKLLESNPERNRQRAYLEQFALKNLKYVGNMKINDYAWALILDPKGNLHHLQVGDYIGQNNGKIKEISDQGVVIRELMPNNDGKWETSEVSLQLTKAKKNNNEQDESDKGDR